MLPLSYSFAPNGTYFVFNLETGKTVRKDLANVKDARKSWIALRSQHA